MLLKFSESSVKCKFFCSKSDIIYVPKYGILRIFGFYDNIHFGKNCANLLQEPGAGEWTVTFIGGMLCSAKDT